MLELLLRLVASLAVVIGLLLLLARLGSRRFSGGADSLVRVVHRQPLSRTSSIAVVDVAGRVLVLGATEHQISLVTELDAVDLENAGATLHPVPSAVEPARGVRADLAEDSAARSLAPAAAAARAARPASRGSAAVAGSVLSPATWQAAKAALGGSSAGKRRAGGSRRAS